MDIHPILSLVLGIAFAGLGGELFVKGVVGLAQWARIPAGVIGATVAAFATSSPELTVSINAALAGTPQIALGDALGSNVVNIGLVLGIALLFGPIKGEVAAIRRDFLVAMASPILAIVLLADGELSTIDGSVLMAVFVGWLGITTVQVWRKRDATQDVLGEPKHAKAVTEVLFGLILLIMAGTLIVTGAKFVGHALGWNSFVVGATLVALGTSMPELATTVVSRMRGHDEVGLGTIIGSNIFNGLFIVSIASLIHPIKVDPKDVAMGLGCGVVTLCLAWPTSTGLVPKWRAIGLLGAYAIYVLILIL
jgi:cation:H+ antiporter